MNAETLFVTPKNSQTSGLAQRLLQAIDLIGKLDDDLFTEDSVGGVGCQFRHCLDFVTCFVAGIRCGQIDYTRRERDFRVAQNRQHAISRFAFAIRELQSLGEDDLERPVNVRLEERAEWAWSSAKRELDFVSSHTIHHFALIAEKLRARNVFVDENFGVASSTMKFWTENSPKSETA